jgi:hypothetical protein
MAFSAVSRGCFPKQVGSECPFCKQQTCITIESRINKDNTRRRRKECTECKHRYTAYEVSEEFYKTALVNQRAVDNFIKSLNLNLTPQLTHDFIADTCDDCVYMRSSGCSFDFPDAGGTFAGECSMFERETV